MWWFNIVFYINVSTNFFSEKGKHFVLEFTCIQVGCHSATKGWIWKLFPQISANRSQTVLYWNSANIFKRQKCSAFYALFTNTAIIMLEETVKPCKVKYLQEKILSWAMLKDALVISKGQRWLITTFTQFFSYEIMVISIISYILPEHDLALS